MADGGNFRQIVVIAARARIGFVGAPPKKRGLQFGRMRKYFCNFKFT